MFKLLTLALASLLPITASASILTEPLPSGLAFQVDLERQDDHTLVVNFEMPQGYYLYQKRLTFLDTAGFEVSDIQITGLKQITDPELGVEDVLDSASHVVLQGNASAAGQPITVRVKLQGCLKGVLCYPPEVRSLQVH